MLDGENVRKRTALVMVVILVLSGLAVHMPVAVADFPPPVADAGPDQTVQEGEEVTLNASGSFDLNDEPLNYTWDFDDSDGLQADATGIEAVTSYEDSGIYTVTLTVSDGQFESTDTCRITVTPTSPDNTPPKAIITSPLPNVYNVSEQIVFEGTGVDLDNDPLTGKWNFGDGTTSTVPSTTHSYSREGAYTIRWTVTDGQANNT
jgi:PKD repeat protein